MAIAENIPVDAKFDDQLQVSTIVTGVMRDLAARSLTAESLGGARIDCALSIDGHASGCRDATPSGPNAFSASFQRALQAPDVVFQPMTLHGSAIPGRHVFAIKVRARRVRRQNGVSATL